MYHPLFATIVRTRQTGASMLLYSNELSCTLPQTNDQAKPGDDCSHSCSIAGGPVAPGQRTIGAFLTWPPAHF